MPPKPRDTTLSGQVGSRLTYPKQHVETTISRLQTEVDDGAIGKTGGGIAGPFKIRTQLQLYLVVLILLNQAVNYGVLFHVRALQGRHACHR